MQGLLNINDQTETSFRSFDATVDKGKSNLNESYPPQGAFSPVHCAGPNSTIGLLLVEKLTWTDYIWSLLTMLSFEVKHHNTFVVTSLGEKLSYYFFKNQHLSSSLQIRFHVSDLFRDRYDNTFINSSLLLRISYFRREPLVV